MATSHSDTALEDTTSATTTARWMTELLSLPLLLLVLPAFLAGCLLANCRDVRLVAFGALALALLTAWGSIVNHYADWQTDAINNKRIWLHRFQSCSNLAAYQKSLLVVYLAVVIVGFGHRPLAMLTFMAGILGALQYSTWLKIENKLWLNDLYLALAYGVYPILVGLVIGGGAQKIFAMTSVLTAAFLLLLDLGVAPFKDYGDLEGDRQTGKRTLPIVYGTPSTVRIQSGMIALAMVIAALLLLSNRSLESWLLLLTCLALMLLLQFRRRDDSHHAEFLHFAALLGWCGRLALLSVLT